MIDNDAPRLENVKTRQRSNRKKPIIILWIFFFFLYSSQNKGLNRKWNQRRLDPLPQTIVQRIPIPFPFKRLIQSTSNNGLGEQTKTLIAKDFLLLF